MKTYKVDVDDDGNKYWLFNNKLHREDGPAVEYADGTKQWYLNGEQFTETDFTFETEWCKQTQKIRVSNFLHLSPNFTR